MKILTNLTKAVVGLAAAPVMVVADVLTLPASAYDNKHPFGRTARTLNSAGDALAEAIKPNRKE